MDVQQETHSIITLTTDFGTQDPFAGCMKGVILRINPDVRIIDISHTINPFDIESAAFLVSCFYSYFPAGTVHCIVVDPEVGSERRPILLKTENYFLVAPDNGVLSYIFEKERTHTVFHIQERRYFLDDVSRTFHGRDIFAPVCAWLSKGIDPLDMGPAITEYVHLFIPKPSLSEDRKRIDGQIIYIDLFGNLVTNIPNTLFEEAMKRPSSHFVIEVKGIRIVRHCNAYSDLEKGEAGVITGSQGYLELFAFRDSLAMQGGIKKGDSVEMVF